MSCKYFYSDNSLGGHYYLWEGDGSREYSIVYNDDGHESERGIDILDENISKVNFNEKFIIAETFVQNKEVHFWIIDKTKLVIPKKEKWKEDILIGPLDSVGLFSYLSREKINLKFDNPKLIK